MATKPTTEVLWQALWGAGGNVFTGSNEQAIRTGYWRAGVEADKLDSLMSATCDFMDSGDITETNFETYVQAYV